MKNTIFILLTLALFASCSSSSDEEYDQEQYSSKIIGKWYLKSETQGEGNVTEYRTTPNPKCPERDFFHLVFNSDGSAFEYDGECDGTTTNYEGYEIFGNVLQMRTSTVATMTSILEMKKDKLIIGQGSFYREFRRK